MSTSMTPTSSTSSTSSSQSTTKSKSNKPTPPKLNTNLKRKSSIKNRNEKFVESNAWTIGFIISFFVILFSKEISNIYNANNEDYQLLKTSMNSTPKLSSWKITKLDHQDRGYGLIATRQILPGELLLKEKPIFKLNSKIRSIEDYETNLNSILKKLDGEDRNRFLSLSNPWQNQSLSNISNYIRILQTNAISIGSNQLAIFPSLSRINHGCAGASNSVYNWREKEGVEVVHATKLIEVGEEILISYWDSKRSRSDRQDYLKSNYGFQCTCQTCSLTEEESIQSDQRFLKINQLKAKLSDWSNRLIGGFEAVRLIEEAVQLMKLQNMTFEFGQLYADAAHIASAHSDFQSVKHFANLAQDHFKIELGSDSIEVLISKKLIKNPTSLNWSNRQPERVKVL
ncbi:uncharacterized protein MELLADRAFT_108480 [Melampsora larici-populina 98AG31]|uniref:SET domain-containing protein n=1 Tax=Melampsora larici-populina (strain 98AG31 / pathotype 3-4-7) TaxID=747676 RepID=F4RT80_MELLP|nr:uncharacterized protein MELLADRAFT_108480 [Melampsora larici-populina 98AG31]EGG04480.1 hypothetical protein MELLADRAFT_108480 [Melampsora larici-populina 98AG31]